MTEAAALWEVRPSTIEGLGVFAVRSIPRGTRLLEYTGERISNEEADRRYDDDLDSRSHTVLFTLDDGTVVDAGVGGNEARYVNHSCDPNCESLIEDRRIYIESIREIASGEELTYDYQLERPGRYRSEYAERYACRCGAPNCRGTLLVKPRRPRRRKRA